MTAQPSDAGAPPARYDDLRALIFNCTLKRSPERSNTQGLIDRSAAIMRAKASASMLCEPSTTTSRSACGLT